MKKLGILRKSKDFLDRPASVLLYQSLALLHLDYCDFIYECTNKSDLCKLQQIQTSACRTMFSADKCRSLSQMHRAVGILPLDERVIHIRLPMSIFLYTSKVR